MMLESLGLSVGTIKLTLDGPIYAPGELVTGVVRLELTHPVQARGLIIGLNARQRSVGLQPGQQGLQFSYRNDKVWDFQVEADGEREYRPGETKRFEFLLPHDAAQPHFTPPGGFIGDVARALSYLTNVKRFPLEWRVSAFLERPWALNPKGEVQLQVGEAALKATVKRKRTTRPKPKAKKKTMTTSRPKRKPAKRETE